MTTPAKDPIASVARGLTAEVMVVVNRYRPGSASADQMTREIRACTEAWIRAALTKPGQGGAP